MTDEERLLEAVADIAYLAGSDGYHSGDSRENIQNFIAWAKEFEAGRDKTAEEESAYGGEDYMSAIHAFAASKLRGK